MTYILIGTNLIPYESNKRADGSHMRSNHSRGTLMSYTDHSAQRRALERNIPCDLFSGSFCRLQCYASRWQ